MSRPIQLTHCTLHLDRNEIEGAQGRVRLTSTECELLSYMVAQAGRTVSKAELLRNVWHYAPGIESRAPDHTINRLRGKIEADPKSPDHLSTVYGVGYRLDLPASELVAEPAAPSQSFPLLPSPPKPLRGRASAEAEVHAWLEQGSQWLTIVGAGGMGKTHLARAVCAGRGALWCDLRSAQTEAQVMVLVGQALGLQLNSDLAKESTRITQCIEARAPEVIVLDNLEQASEAALKQMHDWLDGLPEARIIATSRAPIRLPRETVLRLGSLPEEAAVALFTERAAAVLGEAHSWNPEVLLELVNKLDRMPLAIELAAGRMRILSPAELSERLSEDMGILAGGEEDHHRTLSITLLRSWALLDPIEQEVLKQCTVFHRPFDLCAIEAVVSLPQAAQPALSVLSALVDASMLRRVEGPSIRFDFFALTRQFVEQQGPSVADVLGRHLAHFHDQAMALRAQRMSPESDQAQRLIRHQLPDLLAALQVAEAVDPHAYSEILAAMHPCLGREVQAEQAAALAQTCVSLAESSGDLVDLSEALAARSRVHFVSGRWSDSFSDLERGVQLALEADQPGLAAQLEIQLGSHRIPRGEIKRAEAVLKSGLEHATSAGDVWQQGRATSGLARAYLYLDRRDLATAAFKSALTCCRQVGDREGECRTLGLMGRIESRYGRFAQAELHFQDALDCYRDRELPGRFAWVLASRTEIYLRWGRLADAERCARGALSIANSRGTPAERSVAEFNLGMLLLEMGSTNRAQSHITKSKRVAEALGLSRFLGDVLMGLSWVHFDKGEYPRAEAYWTQASEIHVQTRNTLYQGVVHGIRGLCALGEGRTETAIEALQEAIESPALDTRSVLFFSLALTVAHDKANAHDAARLCLTSIASMKPNHQIDSAAGQIIATHLDRWLMSDRSEKAGRALSEQIALCRRPASPDLCAATACSSELRWTLHLIEKHLSAG